MPDRRHRDRTDNRRTRMHAGSQRRTSGSLIEAAPPLVETAQHHAIARDATDPPIGVAGSACTLKDRRSPRRHRADRDRPDDGHELRSPSRGVASRRSATRSDSNPRRSIPPRSLQDNVRDSVNETGGHEEVAGMPSPEPPSGRVVEPQSHVRSFTRPVQSLAADAL
jgi:hypothetical protein